MAVKVLVSEIGQQLIADVKHIENKETSEVVGYWVKNPRVVVYNRTEDNDISVGFAAYCLVSDESEFSIRASHIVSILEAREDVANKYNEIVYGPPTENEISDVKDVVNEDTVVNEPNTDSAPIESPADLLE